MKIMEKQEKLIKINAIITKWPITKKRIDTRKKGGKIIYNQRHRGSNLWQTVYRKNIKQKIWQKNIYHKFQCQITHGKLIRKYEEPRGQRKWVAVGYSKNLTWTTHDDWHVYQIFDGKINHVTLSNTDIIPRLHANIFILTQELHNCFPLTSEGETLILKNIYITLTIKWWTMAAKDSLLLTISARTQIIPLFWPPGSIINKG